MRTVDKHNVLSRFADLSHPLQSHLFGGKHTILIIIAPALAEPPAHLRQILLGVVIGEIGRDKKKNFPVRRNPVLFEHRFLTAVKSSQLLPQKIHAHMTPE